MQQEIYLQVFAALQKMQLSFVHCIAYVLRRGRRARLVSAALLGRFLPRLGPFGDPDGPFFLPYWRLAAFRRLRLECHKMRRFVSSTGLETAYPAPHSYRREIGAPPVSQPSFGRFLPRLGPFGNPDGLLFCRDLRPLFGCGARRNQRWQLGEDPRHHLREVVTKPVEVSRSRQLLLVEV